VYITGAKRKPERKVKRVAIYLVYDTAYISLPRKLGGDKFYGRNYKRQSKKTKRNLNPPAISFLQKPFECGHRFRKFSFCAAD